MNEAKYEQLVGLIVGKRDWKVEVEVLQVAD